MAVERLPEAPADAFSYRYISLPTLLLHTEGATSETALLHFTFNQLQNIDSPGFSPSLY